MSVVGERTAEESSPPGVVEEPGVSRGLMLKLFSTELDFLVLLEGFAASGHSVSGKNGPFGGRSKKPPSSG